MLPSRALTMFVIALLFGLITASPVQAYEWTIEEEDLGELGIGKEKTTLTGGTFELTTESGITIKCTSLSGAGEITEGGKGSAAITLKGCSVLGAEKVCSVQSPGQSSGTLTGTTATKFFAKEVSGTMKYYEEVSLKMTISFIGEGCTLEEEETVSGSTAAEAPAPSKEPVKRPQKFSEAIAKTSGVTELFFGESVAYLTGEDTVELSGAHNAQPPGMTPVEILPKNFVWGGAGSSVMPTLKNISNANNIKLKNIEIMAGPFTLTEPTPACKGRKLTRVAPNNACTTKITCNTAGMQGIFLVEVDELNAADQVVGTGGRGRRMMC